jgi:hypothetical protein
MNTRQSLSVLSFSILSLFLFLSHASPLRAADSAQAAPAGQEDQWVVYDAKFGPGQGKQVVLISGDEEYRSEEGLTQLGKILATEHGFKCTVLFAIDPMTGLINPKYLKNIPGLEALKTADLMIIATRFRNLPDDQMQQIDDYLKSGRPVMGLRTATHAFQIPLDRTNWVHYDYRYNAPKTWPNSKPWVHWDASYASDRNEWVGGFGGEVLGDTWFFHYGYHNYQSTRGLIARPAKALPITRGLKDGDIWGPTDVYAVRLPLPGHAVPIIMGQTLNAKAKRDDADMFLGMRPTDDPPSGSAKNPTADSGPDLYDPNQPMLPVAWIKSYQIPGGKKGRVFATTMGAAVDLMSEGTRRMLVNAVYWCIGLEDKIPRHGTKVDLVGDYHPSTFRFQSDDYWKKKALRPSSFNLE